MTERKAYQTSLIILQKLFQDLQPIMSLPIEKIVLEVDVML